MSTPRTRPLRERFDEKWEPVTESGCWIWMAGTIPFGYGHIWYKGKTIKAHRASWYLKYGVWPENLICHKCDNPGCVNPDHLYEGTYTDNNRDRDIKWRNGFAKLTPEKIKEIRSSTLSVTELSSIYGISTGGISDIRNKNTWRWV